MAEERKDSFAETVDTAASAAHTVKGAIKAGKAISGAAKGAGSLGRAQAYWQDHRRHHHSAFAAGPVYFDAARADFRRFDQCLFASGHGAACPQQRNCNRGERQRHHFYHQLYLG